MERIIKTFLVLALLYPTFVFAARYGATVTYAITSKEPPTLSGYQLMLDYDPECFQWRRFNIYFDGGISHFSVTSTPYYSTITIYSAAPVIRYTFKQRGPLFPYLDISIGVAYLNHTHFEDRNLGMHFSFQDRMGAGILWGEKKNWSAGLQVIHYSNAHLSNHNSGITIPAMLVVSYRF